MDFIMQRGLILISVANNSFITFCYILSENNRRYNRNCGDDEQLCNYSIY